MPAQLVEILSFEGCPNAAAAAELVDRTVHELGLDAEIRHTRITDERAARARRFLATSSPAPTSAPTTRSPCRVYRTPRGLAGQPDKAWLIGALDRAARMRSPTTCDRLIADGRSRGAQHRCAREAEHRGCQAARRGSRPEPAQACELDGAGHGR